MHVTTAGHYDIGFKFPPSLTDNHHHQRHLCLLRRLLLRPDAPDQAQPQEDPGGLPGGWGPDFGPGNGLRGLLPQVSRPLVPGPGGSDLPGQSGGLPSVLFHRELILGPMSTLGPAV